MKVLVLLLGVIVSIIIVDELKASAPVIDASGELIVHNQDQHQHPRKSSGKRVYDRSSPLVYSRTELFIEVTKEGEQKSGDKVKDDGKGPVVAKINPPAGEDSSSKPDDKAQSESKEVTVTTSRLMVDVKSLDKFVQEEDSFLDIDQYDFKSGILLDAGKLGVIALPMFNLQTPVDIIVMDDTGLITETRANLKPGQLEEFKTTDAAYAVLFLTPGTIKGLEIKAGDKIKHKIFGSPSEVIEIMGSDVESKRRPLTKDSPVIFNILNRQ